MPFTSSEKLTMQESLSFVDRLEIPIWSCRLVRERTMFADNGFIRSAADVYNLLKEDMGDLPHEEFRVLCLSTQNQVTGGGTISVGTLDASLVHPREVFRMALEANAASIILVHNHPSGHTEPSAEDRAVTRQLQDAGVTMGIEVLDHVIIGYKTYNSFAESGLLN